MPQCADVWKRKLRHCFSVGYHDVPVILQAKERRLFLESKVLLVFTDVGFQFGIVFGEVVNKARIHVH